VHDELVLAGPRKRADDMAAALQDGMTGPGIQKLISVPLKADVMIGNRWGELK
jgi:DNA polymerase I-like protein with 3'-5' exonuclease and polymerase domains